MVDSTSVLRRRSTLIGPRCSVSVPPCLRPIDEEMTSSDDDEDAGLCSSSSSSSDAAETSLADDESSVVNVITHYDDTVAQTSTPSRHFVVSSADNSLHSGILTCSQTYNQA